MGTSERPSMQTVADQAGVSKMTVCRALNDDPRISPATRRKVVEAAARLGYRRSPLVSALMAQIRAGRAEHSHVVLAHLHNWPRGEKPTPNLKVFRQALGRQARQLGFRMESFPFEQEGYSLERCLGIVRSRGIRGAVIEHLWGGPLEEARGLDDLALVAVGRSVTRPALNTVDSDQHLEILALMQALRRAGYRRPALANSEAAERMNLFRRRAGFLLAQLDLPARDRLPPVPGEDSAEVAREVAGYVARHRPDVVISQHAGVHAALVGTGCRIPGDIAFAHLGLHPGEAGFGGVDPNWSAKGEAVVNQLVDALNRNEVGPPASPLLTVVPSSIRPGGTLPLGDGGPQGGSASVLDLVPGLLSRP